jgi:hypothetical protein
MLAISSASFAGQESEVDTYGEEAHSAEVGGGEDGATEAAEQWEGGRYNRDRYFPKSLLGETVYVGPSSAGTFPCP